MVKRLAVIPARGGSKRIANKNIRNFCGRPMITYILQTARASGLFDAIHISTESKAIRAVVEAEGLTIDFLRPAELADDDTPIMPVLKFVVDSYAERGMLFDQVWLLIACSPLVESEDLRQAAAVFDNGGGSKPLLAVAEYPVPVEWAYGRSADGALTPQQPGMFARRSQDIAKSYFDAGAFAVFPARTIRESTGAGSDQGYLGYVLGKRKAIDIDDEEDWALAEALFRHQEHGAN